MHKLLSKFVDRKLSTEIEGGNFKNFKLRRMHLRNPKL
jgi:hypothetical protein